MADALTHAQIRGARAMLDWSMTRLAREAGISIATVSRAENERQEPITADALGSIRDALETEGARFLADDGSGVGVRLKVG